MLKPSRFLIFATLVILPACSESSPAPDDDTADGGDDDATADDDSASGDVCDDSPGEIVCDGSVAVTCDVYGDVAAQQACTEDNGPLCLHGVGCVDCFPEQQWCEGDEVVECAADGHGWSVLQTCDAAAGEECLGGECLTLCGKAEMERSSVGCRYYGVDMEQIIDHSYLTYAISVSNVHESITAEVVVEKLWLGEWEVYAESSVTPRALVTFALPNFELSGTAIGERAYRITSDIPVIAYQFNPLDGAESFSSDASLLLPVSALDTAYVVPGWEGYATGGWGSQSSIDIVATQDGTEVTITPTADTVGGSGIPPGQAGAPLPPIELDEGRVLQIIADSGVDSLEGTLIESTEPVVVFAGTPCAFCPIDQCCCDHIEEQVFGLQTWGSQYVAARLPVRSSPPEVSIWQIVAGNSGVALTFEADTSVTGLPPGNVATLGPRETLELQVAGDTANPGDFTVSGTEAFLVTQYMSAADLSADTGDPCMVQTVPVEQFLDSYVVLVPPTWEEDRFVLVRSVGAAITIDGQDVDSWPAGAEVVPVPPSWEVVRIAIEDGAHVLDGATPFGVTVVGYDEFDSYCYPGGLDQEAINDL